MIISTLYISFDYIRYSNNDSAIDNKLVVIDKKDNRYTVKNGIHKYYISSLKQYDIGDILYIKGTIDEGKTSSYSGDYNLKLGLFSKYIDGYINYDYIKVVDNKFTLYKIRYLISNYYKDKIEDNSYVYFKALTLADNDLNNEVFSKLNLAHIIAISGFHIVMIYNFSKKLLFRITNDLYKSDNIAIFIIIFYNIITGFSISVLKATIYLILKRYNDRYGYFTTLDILSTTFIIILLRPRYIFNIGFIMGFLSSFILIFINEIITTKNQILKSLLQGILIYLVLFPFITKINNEVSLLSIFSFLLFDIFSYFLIPYSFVLFIVPSISYITLPSINLINNLLLNISGMFVIKFPTINDLFIYLYYPLLYIFIINNKLINKILISIILLLLVYLPTIITIDKVEFIDVNQGDSTLITIRGEHILIDTHNCYKYLLRKGIYNIKYIFITHDDLDHLSDLDLILSNLDVKRVYTNAYSKVAIDIALKNNVEVIKLRANDTVTISDRLFTILSPSYDHNDDNMNSLVIEYKSDYFNFLFTGDMTVQNEYEILDIIGHIDILKVAHHGSNTSSNKVFIDKIKPKYSIVSVGKNKYGLPSEEVIDLLNKYSTVYLTSIDGNITVYKDKVMSYK